MRHTEQLDLFHSLPDYGHGVSPRKAANSEFIDVRVGHIVTNTTLMTAIQKHMRLFQMRECNGACTGQQLAIFYESVIKAKPTLEIVCSQFTNSPSFALEIQQP